MASSKYDVVVIGAGAAGLAAARKSTAAGRRVAIVEARDRVGGRIHTIRPAGWPLPIEAGAEFIHGRPRETWDAVGAADLVACQVSESQWRSVDGRPRSLEFDDLWEKVFGRLKQLGGDLSFAEFLARDCPDLTPERAAQATAYVEGFNAADSRLVSSFWLREADAASGQGGQAGLFRLYAGYDRLVHWLLAGIERGASELFLSTIVSGIRWQPGRVEVETVSATSRTALAPIQASCAVVTLPLSVLRAPRDAPGSVEFIPDLADKWGACESLLMGPVVKFFLRFRSPFWEEQGLGEFGFLHAPGEEVPTWWTTNPMRTSVLVGWAGGPAADHLARLESSQLLNRALDSLSRMLSYDRQRLGAILDAWQIADWQADPFSRGAYSYVGVGGLDAPRRLAEPVADTLFFAGEATDARLGGTVAGALASGYRAADEVLRRS
jgi:monoamine oxidase